MIMKQAFHHAQEFHPAEEYYHHSLSNSRRQKMPGVEEEWLEMAKKQQRDNAELIAVITGRGKTQR